MCVIDVTGAIFEEISVSPTSLAFLSHPFTKLRARDDLTVEVIFFGNSDKSGDVVVNKEASALANDIKAKL